MVFDPVDLQMDQIHPSTRTVATAGIEGPETWWVPQVPKFDLLTFDNDISEHGHSALVESTRSSTRVEGPHGIDRMRPVINNMQIVMMTCFVSGLSFKQGSCTTDSFWGRLVEMETSWRGHSSSWKASEHWHCSKACLEGQDSGAGDLCRSSKAQMRSSNSDQSSRLPMKALLFHLYSELVTLSGYGWYMI